MNAPASCPRSIRFGSGCSGIEAASVAFGPLGWSAAWLSEIDPFARAVLAHRYPDVPNLGDMTAIARRVLAGEVEAPEVLVGGTPCQSFSIAGLRESLGDQRGNLTLKFVELANAIDFVRGRRGDAPAIVMWENVPGVLSTKDNAFGCFLAGLAGEDVPLEPPGKKWANAGCVYGPARAVAWRTLDAKYFGLAQQRRRVFVVASARNGFDPAQILFEWEGMRRDSAPRRGEGEDVAGTVTSRATGGGGLGTDFECSGGLIAAFGGGNTSGPIGVGACLTAKGMRQDFEVETFVVHGTQDPDVRVDCAHALGRNNGQENAVCVTGDITHALKAEAFDASEDGTGRGQPIVAATLEATAGKSRGAGTPVGMLTPVGQSVRRLMPVECERLQGFPDGWTRIDGKTKDGPRYKAVGNSWAVPVARWIGMRIDAAIRRAS